MILFCNITIIGTSLLRIEQCVLLSLEALGKRCIVNSSQNNIKESNTLQIITERFLLFFSSMVIANNNWLHTKSINKKLIIMLQEFNCKLFMLLCFRIVNVIQVKATPKIITESRRLMKTPYKTEDLYFKA